MIVPDPQNPDIDSYFWPGVYVWLFLMHSVSAGGPVLSKTIGYESKIP